MSIPPRTNSRVPELDGLRGVAILLVVLYHYIYGGFSPGDESMPAKFTHFILTLSWSGVDLFFVLSGFLIGGILMDARDASGYFTTFYIRRFCRILPLYLLWLALFILFSAICPPRTPPEWYSALFFREIPHFHPWEYFIFLQNFYIAKTSLFGSSWLAATWSLAVEEQFYLLLPLMIWLVPPRKLSAVLIVLILLVPVFRVFLYLFHPSVMAYVLLPGRADALLSGVLCACLMRNEKIRCLLQAKRRQLYLVLIGLFVGMLFLTVFGAGKGYLAVLTSFEMVSIGFFWVAAFYACLLLIAVSDQAGFISGVMRLRGLRHFGIIAYGVFLTHMAVNTLSHGLLLGKESVAFTGFPDVLATVLAFLVTWFLAAMSWNFLEKPIVTWGHSFSYNRLKSSDK